MHRALIHRLVIAVLGLAILVGCATKNKVDWNTRIGSYTYDEAVIDLGPADKSETLSDGTKVAEWLTRRTSTPGTVFVTGGYYGRTSIGTAHGGDQVEWFIRLIFDENDVLKDFRELRK